MASTISEILTELSLIDGQITTNIAGYEELRRLLEDNENTAAGSGWGDVLLPYRERMGSATYAHQYNQNVIQYIVAVVFGSDTQTIRVGTIGSGPIVVTPTTRNPAPAAVTQTLTVPALNVSPVVDPADVTAALPPGSLPAWASGVITRSQQETALLIDETNTGCRIAEGSLTSHPGNTYIENLAGTNGYPPGVVGGYVFAQDTEMRSSTVRVEDCIFKGGGQGGASYPHIVDSGSGWSQFAPYQYSYCTFDALGNTGTKGCLVRSWSGKDHDCSMFRCVFKGGSDNFMVSSDVPDVGAPTCHLVECYHWGCYNTGQGGSGSHSDSLQVLSFGPQPILRVYRGKIIGPYRDSNGMNLNAGVGTVKYYDTVIFGGNRWSHNGSGVTEWYNCMWMASGQGDNDSGSGTLAGIGPSNGGNVAWLNSPGVASNCIEIPWDDLPGIQGFLRNSLTYWDADDLGTYQYENGLGYIIPTSYPPAVAP